jgi:two-component system cell cycle response regulator
VSRAGLPPEETTQIIRLDDHIVPRVLIVDDDELVAEHLAILVRKAGYEVSSVNSGTAALEMLHTESVPIVITDRNMPDMDGLTLCKRIRAEHLENYTYVILLTVQDAEEDILSGLEAGADDYLSKRSSSAQLLARLRTAQRILTLERSLRSVIAQKNRLALTDALTGAHNRRYFNRHLNREIRAAWRSEESLSLLVLDIDHFKTVNDRFGHGVGDEVLQEFAKRITEALPRQTDWLARLGGEEFCVVLPQTDLEGAQLVAEKLRTQICDRPIPTTAGSLKVTVSIGVSGLEAISQSESVTVDLMLERADECLYLSKQGGRNRVTVAKRRAI